jgi:tRNA pseudouridine55 synthase
VSDEPLGLLVVDKSKGPTSHDAVAAVRRALGLRRVGHAGTLDPWATGVLLVGVGRATRLLRFLQGTDKAYVGTMVLGVTTSTLDAGGEVTGTFDMAHVSTAQVEAAAASLTGPLDQVPPMVSALHHEGRRLHELAREGIEVERAPRAVRVDRFDVAVDAQGSWGFVVACSAGTYVRSLVDELGRVLGGGAHVATLRRTSVGRFTLDDAVALEGLDESLATRSLRAPLEMVEHLGRRDVDAREASALRNGRVVRGEPSDAEGHVAMVDEDGALVGVGLLGVDGTLRPEVVMTQGGVSRDG